MNLVAERQTGTQVVVEADVLALQTVTRRCN